MKHIGLPGSVNKAHRASSSVSPSTPQHSDSHPIGALYEERLTYKSQSVATLIAQRTEIPKTWLAISVET